MLLHTKLLYLAAFSKSERVLVVEVRLYSECQWHHVMK